MTDRLKRAVKQRFFSVAPADALARGGEERQLERAPGDTNATFSARLVSAWDLWAWGGTPLGLLTALTDAGYPGAYLEIVNRRQYHLSAGVLETVTLPAGMWCTRTDRTFWSEFAVYFHENPWLDVPATTDPRVELLRRLVRRWKSSCSTCSGIFVEVASESWGWQPANPTVDDQGTWGDQGDWGGTVTRYAV